MFKTRSTSQGAAAAPESLEAVRRRARHRLIGAAVLVLIGVVGFPLIFDTQPRPIAVDVPVEIPARNTVRPLPSPVAAEASSAVKDSLDEREQVVAASAALPAAAVEPKPELKAEPKSEVKAETRSEPKPLPTPEPKPETRTESKPAPRTDAAAESARAQAALEGQGAERIVVQVGAYAESARAQEVRLRLERAGLKTYTHVAKTPEGERIRVRIGPYSTRAEADKAAAKVKALGLPTAILTL